METERKTLREWREDRRLTLKGLAELSEFSYQHIGAVEVGRAEATEEFLENMSDVLKVPQELIAPAGQRLNDSAQAPSKVSRQMHEENLNDYRAALHWLAAHLDEAHLQKLRDAAWNEQDAAVPRAVKLLVFDALVASRERQHKKSIPKN